jgi:hypothetical protein
MAKQPYDSSNLLKDISLSHFCVKKRLYRKINRLGDPRRYLGDTHHTFIPTTNCYKLSVRG